MTRLDARVATHHSKSSQRILADKDTNSWFIGYLVPFCDGLVCVCNTCRYTTLARYEDTFAVVYHCNVFPYRQRCYMCDLDLVRPKTDQWPELFDGR